MIPKVTFLLTTYYDAYLDEVVDSIYDQTLTEWEMLIFNTNSGRKLNYSDKRITVIDVPNDSFSRIGNEAHRLAKSNIILTTCDDDPNFPERAEICYNYIQKGIDVFFVGHLLRTVQKEVYGYSCPKWDWEVHKDYRIGASMSMGAYRKDMAPSYNENFHWLVDYVFLTDCYLKGSKFGCSPIPLGLRTKGNSSQEADARKRTGMAVEEDKVRAFYKDDTFLARKKFTKK